MDDSFKKFSPNFSNLSIAILLKFFTFEAILDFFLSALPFFGIFLSW